MKFYSDAIISKDVYATKPCKLISVLSNIFIYPIKPI